MQPTHAKWEEVPPPSAHSAQKKLTNGLPNGHSAEDDDIDHMDTETTEAKEPTIFSDVPPIVSRNYTVIDTEFNAPPISFAGYPGPDGGAMDHPAGPNGLASIPADILDELPEDCRRAFEEAKATELKWKKQWGTEKQSAQRGSLKIGHIGYPV